ncbi:hypothetical protein FAVG1_08842 [Fusarium avenaceum]|nr:hypothetical protein FAVG1_08842 [Fusarium avenaceum]
MTNIRSPDHKDDTTLFAQQHPWPSFTSLIMSETTTVDPTRFSHWICKRNTTSTADTHCNTANGMGDKKCKKCMEERDFGSIAQNKDNKDIGELYLKADDGSEVWKHFE